MKLSIEGLKERKKFLTEWANEIGVHKVAYKMSDPLILRMVNALCEPGGKPK